MKIRTKTAATAALALLVAVILAGCLATQSTGNPGNAGNELPPYGVITTQQAADVLLALHESPDFVLLDIRTSAEVESGHISGADSLDFYSATFRDDLAALDHNLTYLIYCRSGNRTGQTYSMMEELGFGQVYDMGGGITQWIAADYPVCLGPLDAEHSCSGEYPQS